MVVIMKNWIQHAVKRKGIVHKQLRIPEGKKIPMTLLNKKIRALKRKQKKTKSELKTLRRLVLARTLKKISKKR